MEPKTLGSFLYTKRSEKKLTLTEMAKHIEVSIPYLSDIERGRRFPSGAVLKRIAREFRIPASDLQKFDPRIRLSALKRMIDTCPELGVALKNLIDDLEKGRITPEALAQRLGSSR
jgi:transcriptional regulator with XRE-family HTH domain